MQTRHTEIKVLSQFMNKRGACAYVDHSACACGPQCLCMWTTVPVHMWTTVPVHMWTTSRALLACAYVDHDFNS